TIAATNENLKGAFLRIFLGDSTHEVERWWATLHLAESQPQQFNLSKEFTETKFDWWIPLAKLPQGVRTYNLTVHAYLGTQYFRLGSVIETSLTTYAVNCMYWDDDIFDWNNEGCVV
uniref:Uncharacterized protein n=1 Tax=Ciona savignyi TaxID=51511 RepID=H2Z1Y7_CIOSA